MDHRKAVESKASERYLLGEMSRHERDMFEEHYFECVQCAEDVRTGTAFVDNARSVFREEAPLLDEQEEDRGRRGQAGRARVLRDHGAGWLSEWLRPSSLVPMAAAVSLAFITSYQSLVTLPALKKMAVPAMAAPAVLAQATRGELPVVAVSDSGGPVAVSLYTNAPARQLTFEVRSAEDAVVHSGNGPAPAPGAPLVVFLPPASLNKAGTYRLVLRGESGNQLGEYRFAVDRQ